jgi:hypothetical protein
MVVRVIPCILICVYLHFGRKYCFHFHNPENPQIIICGFSEIIFRIRFCSGLWMKLTLQ